MTDIFLSYKREDKALVEALAKALEDERIHKANCRRVPAMLEGNVPYPKVAEPARNSSEKWYGSEP